jgi:hypothetical protein
MSCASKRHFSFLLGSDLFHLQNATSPLGKAFQPPTLLSMPESIAYSLVKNATLPLGKAFQRFAVSMSIYAYYYGLGKVLGVGEYLYPVRRIGTLFCAN